MATETVTKSTNAKLMALKISGGKSLVPAFHQETTSYTCNVNNEISSITLTPTRVIWFKSTITVNGVSVNSTSESQPIELTVGGNVINVTVTAEDEVTTNTYTIYVIRENASLREYVVTVHNFDDIESLYVDLENSGTGQHNTLPNRAVECQLRRPVSRNTHYWLTDEEARTVAADPRVLAVNLADGWTEPSNQLNNSTGPSQVESSTVLVTITPPTYSTTKNNETVEEISESTLVENIDAITTDNKTVTAFTGPKSLGTLNCMVPVTILLVP